MKHIPIKKRTLTSVIKGVKHWLDIQINRNRLTQINIPALELKFSIPKNTIFSWHLTKYGSYEPGNTNFLIDQFDNSKSKLFVDVGANFGWYSCLLSKLAGVSGKVIAIEPDVSNLSLLDKNINQNSLVNVDIFPLAVSYEKGWLPIHKAPDSNPGMHSFVAMSHTPDRPNDARVQISTLDDLLDKFPGEIDLIKMDIEGFEVNALKGAKNTLARCQNLLIEYSPGFLKSGGQNPAEFFSLINNAGLRVHTISNGNLIEVSSNSIETFTQKAEQTYYFQQDFYCKRY